MEVSFSTIVSDVTLSIQNLIADYNVNIETDFNEVDTIFSIKSFLHSIIYNLITNGIKYRSPDRAPVVLLITQKTADLLSLTITDNGLGIDMNKNQHKVFGLYKRFHLHIEGKGIGLYMTKRKLKPWVEL